MPRKTKELEEIPVKTTKKTTKTVEKKDTVKKATTSKPSGTASKNEKKVKSTDAKTKSKVKDTTAKAQKNTSASKSSKKASTSKVTKATKKASTSKTTKTAEKKASGRKTTKTATKTPAKSSKSKNIKTNKADVVSIVEYYDLPYRYNQTIVKILAQTPNMLFVYWDIADVDRRNFEEHYGSDFFSKTKPVLIIHNTTMNYSFEIEINDFANSWYLHVNDADCKYNIELGRRPYTHTSTIKEDYIYISSSNEMNSPNNHILFEKFNPNVAYKNLKNGTTTKKDFSSLANYKNMQEIYNIYDLYKTIYKDELFGEIVSKDLTNPSSMSSSSFI